MTSPYELWDEAPGAEIISKRSAREGAPLVILQG